MPKARPSKKIAKTFKISNLGKSPLTLDVKENKRSSSLFLKGGETVEVIEEIMTQLYKYSNKGLIKIHK